jgi:hypothetical protein
MPSIYLAVDAKHLRFRPNRPGTISTYGGVTFVTHFHRPVRVGGGRQDGEEPLISSVHPADLSCWHPGSQRENLARRGSRLHQPQPLLPSVLPCVPARLPHACLATLLPDYHAAGSPDLHRAQAFLPGSPRGVQVTGEHSRWADELAVLQLGWLAHQAYL